MSLSESSAYNVRVSSVVVAVQLSPLEPFRTIWREGQCATWLRGDAQNERLKIRVFSGWPLGRVGGGVERVHESLRWSRWGKITVPMDRFLLNPWTSCVPSWERDREHSTSVEAIRVRFPDALPLLQWKYLGLFKYFLEETTEDFLYTTNVSAYLRLGMVATTASLLPRRGLLAGSILEQGRRRFVSGANRWMSRDVVRSLVDDSRDWDRGRLEDIGLSTLVMSLGIEPVPLPTVNISSLADVEALDLDDLRSNYHFRIKGVSPRSVGDVIAMQALHERIQVMS